MHTLQTVLLFVPVLLFSVIAHEIAHGYAALRQGDTTALDAGRLSWDPSRHIDPFFTVLLPLMMLLGSLAASAVMSGARPIVLGGAKPVPVNPLNYRNVRRGDIIVSLAGVFANLVIGILCAVLIVALGYLGRYLPAIEQTLGIFQAMLVIGIWLNAVLIAFNLLPIPPLDGSHVFKYLLPRPLAVRYVQAGRYGLLVLMLLLFVGDGVLGWWMTPVQRAADATIQLVSPHILPGAQPWLK